MARDLEAGEGFGPAFSGARFVTIQTMADALTSTRWLSAVSRR